MTDTTKLPKHKFWGAGESDCPQELKGSNGELHTMRCKVCGDGWRKSSDVCLAALSAAVPELTLRELDALGHAYFKGPLNSDEEMFGRAVERAVRRRLLGTAGVSASVALSDEQIVKIAFGLKLSGIPSTFVRFARAVIEAHVSGVSGPGDQVTEPPGTDADADAAGEGIGHE